MTKFDPITIGADREEQFLGLLSRTWEELETFEFNDQLHFPHEIIRVRAGGKRERIQVVLRVPREHITRRARLAARQWAADEGLDPALDPDLFDNMDSLCLLCECIRNKTPPHEPWVPTPQELEIHYDRPSLDFTWARLEALRKIIDPRTTDLSEDMFLALVATLAKKAVIDPLVVLDSNGQENFILRMASRLQSYIQVKSS